MLIALFLLRRPVVTAAKQASAMTSIEFFVLPSPFSAGGGGTVGSGVNWPPVVRGGWGVNAISIPPVIHVSCSLDCVWLMWCWCFLSALRSMHIFLYKNDHNAGFWPKFFRGATSRSPRQEGPPSPCPCSPFFVNPIFSTLRRSSAIRCLYTCVTPCEMLCRICSRKQNQSYSERA